MADMSAPLVSVILLNWNGWRDTIDCLESLFRQDYPNWNVVVCDNASTDDSVDRIREWAGARPVTIHATGANLGFAAGNNAGIRYAMSRWSPAFVWVLNNDTAVAPDALSRMVARAGTSDRVGAVGATIFEYESRDVVQFAAGGGFGPWHCFGVPNRGTREATDLAYITGASILLPAATIEKVGLIDERYFMYGEDVDYSFRIRAAGLQLVHAPDAHIWHKGGASMGQRSPGQDYYAVRNSLYLVAKYYPGMTPISLSYLLYRSVVPKMARGQWRRLGVLWRAFRDYLRGVSGVASALPGEASRPG
jgi:GT2 family glycosyltransferase